MTREGFEAGRLLEAGMNRAEEMPETFFSAAGVDGPSTWDPDTVVADALDICGNAILRLAYTYVHSMEDAQEILQDTLLRLLKARPVFESDSHRKAWLLRVASNLSKNRIVYNRRRAADELREELVAEQREDLSFVWDGVQALPEKYRAALHLYYQEGYATAEIAKILGRKESTVRTLLRRGREKLRKILVEDFGV